VYRKEENVGAYGADQRRKLVLSLTCQDVRFY